MSDNKRKLRVLFSSNGHHTPSGYGSQLAEIIPNFSKDADIAVSAFYGLQGGEADIEGVKTYPAIDGDVYGMQAMSLHASDFKADTIITNQDIWPLDPHWMQKIERMIPWVPIDLNPVPKAFIDRLSHVYRIIVYSKFGQKQLENNGLASTYIPMGVDTSVFRARDKKAMRDKFKIPQDAFLFGMVAANRDYPSRKNFQEVIDAFVFFLQKHPEAYLLTHSVVDNVGGFPIRDYCRYLGIENKLLYHNHYETLYKFPKPRVAGLMSTFDCLLNPSRNEGFGLPIIEAQACGIPVITTNFTSMPELIKPDETGFLVEPSSLYYTPLGSYIANVHPKGVYEAMEKVYKADRDKMGKSARKWIVNNFDTNLIYATRWKPYLDILTNELVV